MKISDKLKAVLAGFGSLGIALGAAAEDGGLDLNEVGVILVAAAVLGRAVWQVRNKPAT